MRCCGAAVAGVAAGEIKAPAMQATQATLPMGAKRIMAHRAMFELTRRESLVNLGARGLEIEGAS